jgi:hypothetical protein
MKPFELCLTLKRCIGWLLLKRESYGDQVPYRFVLDEEAPPFVAGTSYAEEEWLVSEVVVDTVLR